MQLFIYSLKGTLFEGESAQITLPSEEGEITVLNNHVPLVTSLKKGIVKVATKEGKKDFPVEKGVFQMNKNNKAILLVD